MGVIVMRFAQRLKLVRKELGLKQDELAKACDVQLGVISKYENEIIKPAFEMLSKMGLAYNINLNWLINEIGEMFIETAQRKLIKNGSDGFFVEINDSAETTSTNFVSEGTHSLELENDLKVEYYGIENEKYTKIYRKTGELECSSQLDTHTNEKLENLQQKLIEISQDEDLYDFVLTAINAIDDENALKELKILIKGMELSKK